MRVLVLAGTEEARALVALAQAVPDLEVIASLAGVTARPERYAGEVRRGGFGGVAGYRQYLRDARIGAVVDATHPFADVMSQTAAAVGAELDLPLLRLERPPWVPGPGERWEAAESLQAALDRVTGTVLLTTGIKTLAARLPKAPRLILRSIERPEGPLPENLEILQARPPFTLEQERDLMAARGITALVTKNAGGAARAKLDAAAQAGITVHMVRRPPAPQPQPQAVASPQGALRWLCDVAKETPPAAPRA